MLDYSWAKIELMALKWSICDKFKDYLLGSKFTVSTDNNPLCYIKSSKLGAAQICWLSELALYGFDIIYHSGKSNLVTDALSCHPEVEEETEKKRFHPKVMMMSGLRYHTKSRSKGVASVPWNSTK